VVVQAVPPRQPGHQRHGRAHPGRRRRKRALKKDRFVTLTDADPAVDWELVKRAQYLAGLKGYVTNISAEVIDGHHVVAAYHDLYQVERSFALARDSTGTVVRGNKIGDVYRREVGFEDETAREGYRARRPDDSTDDTIAAMMRSEEAAIGWLWAG
jgi:hypothetical protein